MTQEISEAAVTLAVNLSNNEAGGIRGIPWVPSDILTYSPLRAFARYIDANTATVRQPIPESVWNAFERPALPKWALEEAERVTNDVHYSRHESTTVQRHHLIQLAALIAHVYPEPEPPRDLADLIVDDVKTILGGPAASSAAQKLTAALRQALEKHGIKGPPQP